MSISNKTATNAFIFNIIIRYQFLDIISNNINNSSESVVFLEDFKKKE